MSLAKLCFKGRCTQEVSYLTRENAYYSRTCMECTTEWVISKNRRLLRMQTSLGETQGGCERKTL